MCRASSASISDIFSIFRLDVHVAAKNTKHCPLLQIYFKVGMDRRQQRIEDKALLLGIDSVNGLDHPLVQFLLKPSFLGFCSETKNVGSYFKNNSYHKLVSLS